MFQFAGFASHGYVFTMRYRSRGGFPHSEIIGSKPARGSPMLIATCYVLHRLSVPRHPPDALHMLDLDAMFIADIPRAEDKPRRRNSQTNKAIQDAITPTTDVEALNLAAIEVRAAGGGST